MPKVLVVYATKHHATADIAEAIAEELRTRGIDADCRDAADATCAGYAGVIVGSAVYLGRWLKQARAFLKDNRAELAQVPFWIFSSGPVGAESEGNANWLEPAKILELAETLGTRGHVVFGGRLPADPHGFVEKAMVRATPEDSRDARDWSQIRGWAADIADELRTGS